MLPFVQPVLFATDFRSPLVRLAVRLGWHVYRVPRANGLGTPFLKDMFAHLRALHNASDYYGYANGDILFDDGMLATLRNLQSKLAALPNQLVIGRRTNVHVDYESLTPIYRHNDLKKLVRAQNTNLFISDAEDYFVMAGAFPWHAVPDLIIGRPGYDNFLVATAITHNVSVIDASRTVLAVHQTGDDGNYAGRHNADSDYNRLLVANYDRFKGLVSSAHYRTNVDVAGDLFLEEGTPIWKLFDKKTRESPDFYEKALKPFRDKLLNGVQPVHR